MYVKVSFILNPSNARLSDFTAELFPVFVFFFFFFFFSSLCILIWLVNLWEGHKVCSIFQYYLVLPISPRHQLLFSEHLMLLVLRVRGGDRNIRWEMLVWVCE